MTVRDSRFFSDDGAVVIQVQGVLFKVQKDRLTQSSAALRGMFEVPHGDGKIQEGTSEEHPIVLDDDLDEFRSLLWALHLMPHQVAALIHSAPSKETCTQLLQVAHLAHKYLFDDLDRWALATVYTFLEKLPFPLCRAFLDRMLRVTATCDPDALPVAEELVRTALDTGKADLSAVIGAAEALGMQRLAGHAYHRMLVRGGWLTSPALSATQRTNMLHAYHKFTELWLYIRRTQPVIQYHACLHLGPCLWMWGEIWKETIVCGELLAIPPVNVLAKLNAIKASTPFLRERNGQWPDKGGTLSFVCRSGAEAVINDRIAEIEEDLYSYFVSTPSPLDNIQAVGRDQASV